MQVPVETKTMPKRSAQDAATGSKGDAGVGGLKSRSGRVVKPKVRRTPCHACAVRIYSRWKQTAATACGAWHHPGRAWAAPLKVAQPGKSRQAEQHAVRPPPGHLLPAPR